MLRIINKIIFTFLFLILFTPIFTSASSAQSDNEIISKRSPYVEIGDTIVIDKEVNDDVYLLANTVIISNTVNGDVFVLASTILIDAPINGDLRVASEKLEIKAPIDGNVTFLNTNTYISTTGEVKEDVYGITNKIYHDGRIEGDLNLGFSPQTEIIIEGNILGDLILKDARPIYGDQSYIEGNIDKLSDEEKQDEGKLGEVLLKLLHSLLLITIAALFFKLSPKRFRKINHRLVGQPFKNIAFGLSLFLLTPVISVILAITLIGIPILMIYISLIIIIYFISPIFIGTLIGKKILNLKKTSYLAIIIGILLYDVITLIPNIGVLLNISIYILVSGTFLNLLFGKTTKSTKKIK